MAGIKIDPEMLDIYMESLNKRKSSNMSTR